METDETIHNFGQQKGRTQKTFLLKRGNRRFSTFCPPFALKPAQKPFFLDIWIIMKNFLAALTQRTINVFFDFSLSLAFSFMQMM